MFGKKKKRKFLSIYPDGKSSSCNIIVDKDTGVNYLFVNEGYAGGLTVMVDKNGKPIVTPKENKNEKPEIASFQSSDIKPIINSTELKKSQPTRIPLDEDNQ